MNTVCDWLFCCDGDDTSGLGHVGRCLGYAEMLSDIGLSSVFFGNYGAVAQEMIQAAGFTYQIRATDGWQKSIRSAPPRLGILLDSYTLTPECFEAIRTKLEGHKRLIVIDDFAEHSNYCCDGIINFTIGALSRVYPKCPAELYLGLKYFPARRWLRNLRQTKTDSKGARRVLIIPGGSDRTGVTQEILRCMSILAKELELEVELVVPEERLGDSELTSLLAPFHIGKMSSLRASLQHAMSENDVCVCGGGLTKYECLYAGVPVASLAQTAAQQEDSIKLSDCGWIANMGCMEEPDKTTAVSVLRRFLTDSTWRQTMSHSGLEAMGGTNAEDCLKPFLNHSQNTRTQNLLQQLRFV